MILLGLGTNIGNRRENLSTAVEKLRADGRLRIEKISSIYETEPFGLKEQASFLNAVIQIWTKLSPEALLALCQKIEREMGRIRRVRWGPRIIDIDLLVYERVFMRTNDLILPHPYLAQRRFVLEPMAEITDEEVLGRFTAKDLLMRCADRGKVEVYQKPHIEETTDEEPCQDFIDERADRSGACESGRSCRRDDFKA